MMGGGHGGDNGGANGGVNGGVNGGANGGARGMEVLVLVHVNHRLFCPVCFFLERFELRFQSDPAGW